MSLHNIKTHLECSGGTKEHLIEPVDGERHNYECVHCDLRLYGWEDQEYNNFIQEP